nr:hypothetical protein [Alkalilimnicola ehrlichii]
MHHALVPVHAGVLSALGMLAAPHGRQLSHTLTGTLTEIDPASIESTLAQLATEGRAALRREGVADAEITARAAVDLRYVGQAYTLTVPWEGIAPTTEAFHRAHADRYGHRLEEVVELVNVRVAVTGPTPKRTLAAITKSAGSRAGKSDCMALTPRFQFGSALR